MLPRYPSLSGKLYTDSCQLSLKVKGRAELGAREAVVGEAVVGEAVVGEEVVGEVVVGEAVSFCSNDLQHRKPSTFNVEAKKKSAGYTPSASPRCLPPGPAAKQTHTIAHYCH
jgi:hypothetical protein